MNIFEKLVDIQVLNISYALIVFYFAKLNQYEEIKIKRE
jgi:hypothetical protein